MEKELVKKQMYKRIDLLKKAIKEDKHEQYEFQIEKIEELILRLKIIKTFEDQELIKEMQERRRQHGRPHKRTNSIRPYGNNNII